MEAIAHSPSFAKKVGVKQSVGKDFAAADKGKKFKEGGMAESKKMVKKEVSFMKSKGAPKSMIKHEMSEAGMKPKAKYMSFTEKGKPAGMKPVQMAKGGMTASKMGAVKTAAPSRDGVAQRGKTKGKNLGDSGKTMGIMGGARRGK